MSPENKALVEALIPDYGERSIARLYPETLEALLQAARAEERGKGPTREEVARIIDPPAWETRDRIYSFPDAVTEWVDRHVAPSLAKADAILALFQKDKSL
jgi:hypothetical protein